MSKETKTHKLGELRPDANGLLSLTVRQPGWHPDAFDGNGGARTNIFPEEALGKNQNNQVLAFYAQFAEGADNSRWILGNALHSSTGGLPFTLLLNDLATLARRYNAALHTLRRLRFHFDLFGGPHQFPPANPHSRDQDLSGLTQDQLRPLVADAEADWTAKSQEINDFLDSKAPGFADPQKYKSFLIQAADMIEVNNYIVSMRVNVLENAGLGQLVGSSSHVSISSAFSSSSP